MKKEVVLGVFFVFLLFCIFSISLSLAQENDAVESDSVSDSGDSIDLAYQCLKDEIDSKSSISLSEAIYASLALGNYGDLSDTIEDDKRSGEDCWPKSSCGIEETAKVLLTYEGMNRNTDEIVEWLFDKNVSVTGLNWYLEVDIQNQQKSSCTLRYEGIERTIEIGEDQKLSGDVGRCLSITSSGYWMEIRESCIDNEFEISCDQDFISTLLYEKNNGDTIFVSADTHSASGLGSTKEQVSARCFSTGSSCDYQGSLWAALALDFAGEDVSAFIPYLVALSEDNRRYFPDAFLYILRGGEESYQVIVESQKQGKFWEVVGTPEDRYHDTSLALLALGDEGTSAGDNAKSYLLDIQTEEGCWDNNDIKSTGLVLYSAWPRSRASGGGGGGGTIDLDSCVSSGNYCVPRFACEESGGLRLNQYECSGFNTACCSVDSEKLTCSERNGEICASNEECSGRELDSSDGNCCDSTCVLIEEEEENECERNGGSCETSCIDGEQEIGDSCSISGDVCCISEGSGSNESGSLLWLWIVLLVILIILVILGIVYRNKIRLWWHTLRNKGKSGSPGSGPGPRNQGPGSVARRAPPSFLGGRGPPGPPGPPRAPPRRPPVNQRRPPSKDYEDTMKKLKEIGKK